MKQIPLQKNRFALVDDGDFNWLSQWNWFYHKTQRNAYVARTKKSKGIRTKIYMHRFIMSLQKGDRRQIDHINSNGLDNRRRNLRICTSSQNGGNRKISRGTSRYKGVCYYKDRSNWVAHICKNGKSLHIGYFTTEVEAAKAYDVKAVELFGEFAKTNFPNTITHWMPIPQLPKE